MKAALVRDDLVVNVIEYDPENEYVPDETLNLIVLENDQVCPGWKHLNGAFIPPPEKFLRATLIEFSISKNEAPVVYYKNTYSDAPSEVVFDVNGATATVSLVDDGVAELEVTASQPGEVLVTCDGLSITLMAMGG